MINIVGAGGVMSERYTKLVSVNMVDKLGIETEVEFIVFDEACGKAIPLSEEVLIQFEDYDIVNNTKEEIDILVGMSSPQFHEHRIIKGEPNNLILIETPFGNCVVGPAPRGRDGNYQRGSIKVNNVSVTEKLIMLV